MKTKINPCLSVQCNQSNPRASGPPIPGRARRCQPIAILACLGALTTGALAQSPPFNILDNDPEHGFKPVITFSDNYSEAVAADRSTPPASFDKASNPERIAATVVGNLVEFPFTEIAEDMPVSLRVGNFAFEAELGDASRPKNRDGTLRPFDPNKTCAVFFLRAEFPPVKPDGEPRIRTVGSVKFSWTLRRVTARLALSDAAAVGADGILTPDEALFPERTGATTFACEKIPVEISFGSATGSRTAFGRGRLSTLIRKVGSERAGNATELALHSLAMVGEADTAAPRLVTRVPTIDGSPDQLLSFNGTVSDMAARPLSEEAPDLPSIHVAVNGVPLQGGTSAEDDYELYITEGDASGQHRFTVTNLPLPAVAGGVVTVSIYAQDASGNRSEPIVTQVTLGTSL